MTFKDLKKRVSSETIIQQQSKLFEICKDSHSGFGMLMNIDEKTLARKDIVVLIIS